MNIDSAYRYSAIIEAMIKSDYIAAISQLRWLDTIEGKWRYLHSQKNAISRIEKVFHELFSGLPWPAFAESGPDWKRQRSIWRNELGYYCDCLGVATLIDDMCQVEAKGLKPRSLIYFLRSHDKHRQEQSSRWEMMLYAQMEEDWQETKRREAGEAEEAILGLGVKVMKSAPAWVIDARKTLQRIAEKASPTPEELREVAKIKAIMSRLGEEP